MDIDDGSTEVLLEMERARKIHESQIRYRERNRSDIIRKQNERKANETEEERTKRFAYHKEYYRKREAMLSVEEKEMRIAKRMEKRALTLANETEEEKKERMDRQREYERNYLDNLTEEQKKERMNRQRGYERTYEEKLNDAEREERLDKRRECMEKLRRILPEELKDWNKDPAVNLKFLHAMCAPLLSAKEYRESKDSVDISNKVQQLFASITKEETQSQIEDFRRNIHPSSIMYGCATCGIRVIPFGDDIDKIYQFSLRDLQPLFQYSDNEISLLKEESTVLTINNNNKYYEVCCA